MAVCSINVAFCRQMTVPGLDAPFTAPLLKKLTTSPALSDSSSCKIYISDVALASTKVYWWERGGWSLEPNLQICMCVVLPCCSLKNAANR